MKLLRFTLIISAFILCFVSCGGDEEDFTDSGSSSEKSCESNFDCPLGYTCDSEKKVCTDGSDSGDTAHHDGGDTANPDETDSDTGDTAPGPQDGDNDPITGSCEPGKKQTCPYQGNPETENVGPCRAGIRTCKEDSTWGRCEGEVLPEKEFGEELCSDGIDNDCNGVVDDGTDFDGDGHGACSDCCESTDQCPFPDKAWDNSSDLCEYEVIETECESGVSESSTNPFDYAKAIGICKTTTEDSNDWGLISATISFPTGSGTAHSGSNGLLSAFGNVIKPKEGNLMLALTSSKLGNPVTDPDYNGGTTSGAPADWVAANGGKFPSAASCSTSGTSGDVNDAVMLQMKIRVPKTARSFSFNIYFITKEYPSFICSRYNDFFIALLDSNYTSNDPNLQNPKDKNLAMDAAGNPVGINLAASGLFPPCSPVNGYPATNASCIGTEELKGTGFASNGGTGWLTTRGNVIGGEVITLRLAIWDLYDHIYDSIVLIDNFKWDAAEYKPGTGQF
jgi:hypothetical protein